MLLTLGVGSSNADKQREIRTQGLIGPEGALIGSITSGGAEFSYHTDFTSVEGARNNFSADGNDNLWATWWYFRVNGDTQEYKFPAPDNAIYSGNVATLTWNDVGGLGLFSAGLVHNLNDPVANSATLVNTMTLTDLSGNSNDIEIFHYIDFDLADFNNDEALLTQANNYISLVDNVTPNLVNVGELRAGGNVSFIVRAYSDDPNIRGLLNDTLVDDLDNTGLPFGPGDFTGAFQWSISLAANGYSSVESTFAIGATAAPIPNDPYEYDPDLIYQNGFE